MTSLQKQWQNPDLSETYQNIYHSKGIDESYPKMCFLLNLRNYVKNYRHFCRILALFTMPAHQIWSCHVTQDPNFEIFYFVLILHLISGKVTKFPVEKLSMSEVISKKPQGVENTPPPPPSAFRVKELICNGFLSLSALGLNSNPT